MTHLYAILSDELIHALGWTFVHSLWQGSLIALVMTGILSAIQPRFAKRRYLVSIVSLISVLICSLITFALLYQAPGAGAVTADTFLVAEPLADESPVSNLYGWISQYNPILVSIWIIGVVFFALRFCFGLFYLRHMKSVATTASKEWQQTLDRIVSALGYQRHVTLVESRLLRIPVVIGYLKPVILFPIGVVNQLQTDEVEAILAHEVAHLVRNDFIQNLIQSVVEMIFYYHPAVWWISAVVRSERENCCDDLAVQVCNNSLTYAKALIQLEDISYHAPALALPFSGSKGHLLNRIKRILNQPQNKSNVMERIIATVILVGCVTLLSFTQRQTQAQSEPEVDIAIQPVLAEFVKDSVPEPRQVTVWKTVDGKEIEMRSENGEITSLRIDGEEIDPAQYEEHAEEIESMRELAVNSEDLPPVPPIPPVPPVPAVPPMPSMEGMPVMPPMPPMPAMPAMPTIPEPMNFHFEFFGPEPAELHEGKSNKTTIIRERSGNGYSYHVESEGDTEVEIDGDRGVALINGQEVQLDADSVFIIETQEHTGKPGAYFYGGNADDVLILRERLMDSIPAVYRIRPDRMTEEQKAEWKAYSLDMKDYARHMEQYNNQLNSDEWKEYQKQLENWGKEWENSDEWKAYQEQMKEWGNTWQNSDEWKAYEKQMENWSKEWENSAKGNEYLEKSKEYERQLKERQALANPQNRMEMDQRAMRADQIARERESRAGDKADVRFYGNASGGSVLSTAPRVSRDPFAPITRALDKDGLIDADGEYNVVLEEDKLKINGKKMPDSVHEKYLDLFERTQGYRLSGKSKIEISN